jgi:DNA-binding MarR family transcriptional regulator
MQNAIAHLVSFATIFYCQVTLIRRSDKPLKSRRFPAPPVATPKRMRYWLGFTDEPTMTRKTSRTDLELSEFLPYLLNRAGVKTGQVFSQDLEDAGIVLSEWRIMIALWQKGNLRLKKLAEITVSDLSTMSRQVRAMEKSGLIVRKQSDTDGRALSLVLTPKGRSLTARLIPVARLHERIATDGITEKEIATMRRCAAKIYHNLDAFDKSRNKRGATKALLESKLAG